jgi:hypothetical protein
MSLIEPIGPMVSPMVSNLVAEMVLAGLWRTGRLLAKDDGKHASIDRTLVFLTVLAHSLPRGETEQRQPGISVNAMALSFNLPFETTRRHVGVLLADGWCERISTGIVVSDTVLTEVATQECIDDLHDLMVWLAEQFQLLDLPLPSPRATASASREMVTLAAVELILAAIDFGKVGFRNLREFYIVHAIVAGSARKVTIDPLLSRQLGATATLPPPNLRRGVNVHRLAGLLTLPPVTTYRHVNRAIQAGKLERCPGGVRAAQSYLATPKIHADARLATARAQRAFQRLASAGFAFDAPSRQYSGGRPNLPDWGQ